MGAIEKLNLLIYIAIFLVGIITWSLIGHKKLVKALNRLKESRPHLDRDHYVKSFKEKGINENLIQLTYDEITSYPGLKNFPIYPEDDLVKDYEIDPEDLEDSIKVILNNMNALNPSESEYEKVNKEYENKALTVEYIFRLYEEQLNNE